MSLKGFRSKNPAGKSLLDFRKNGGLPLLFLLLIFLPMANMVFKFSQPLPIKEKRKLAALPRFTWSTPWDFLRRYEAYFNDHFGFRSQLVYWNNRLTVHCFGISPIDKVIVGRQGWLFMAKETETRDELDYFRSLRPFTPMELQHWRQALRQRRAWLASRGIAYIFLVVPNKSTIYPEYMPPRIRRRRGASRLDQLLAALRQDKDFPLLDIREPLRQAKKSFMTYDKTDSHWNELGAYVAFEAIMGRLAADFPGLERPSLQKFRMESQDRAGGDLAQMLSLQKHYFREREIRLRPRARVEVRSMAPRRNLGPFIRETISECPSAPLPPLLMVHDSFAHQLKPLLSPCFRRAVYIWDWELNFFEDTIENEKPGIVIEEIAERMLCDLVLKNPPDLEDGPGH